MQQLIQGSAHALPDIQTPIVQPLILLAKSGPRVAYEVVGKLGYSRNETHVCVVIPPATHYVYRPKQKLQPFSAERWQELSA